MSNLLWRVVNYVLYLTETRRHGYYVYGDVLFTSETNSVDVRFLSDHSVSYRGFYLNIRSILCGGDSLNSLNSDDCDDITSEELVIAAEDFLEGALVTDTEDDSSYPNNRCQNWNIMTDENQVYVLVFSGYFPTAPTFFAKLQHAVPMTATHPILAL